MKQPTKLASSKVVRHRRLHRLNPEEVLLQKEALRLRLW